MAYITLVGELDKQKTFLGMKQWFYQNKYIQDKLKKIKVYFSRFA